MVSWRKEEVEVSRQREEVQFHSRSAAAEEQLVGAVAAEVVEPSAVEPFAAELFVVAADAL